MGEAMLALRDFESALEGLSIRLQGDLAALRRALEDEPAPGGTEYRVAVAGLREGAKRTNEDLLRLEAEAYGGASLQETLRRACNLHDEVARGATRLEEALGDWGYEAPGSPLPDSWALGLLGSVQEGRARGDAAVRSGGDEPDELGEASGETELPEVLGGGVRAAVALARSPASSLSLSPEPAPRVARGLPASPGPTPPATLWAATSQAVPGSPGPIDEAGVREGPATGDTPSSLASPQLFSPSLRELLGRYASNGRSSSGSAATGPDLDALRADPRYAAAPSPLGGGERGGEVAATRGSGPGDEPGAAAPAQAGPLPPIPPPVADHWPVQPCSGTPCISEVDWLTLPSFVRSQVPHAALCECVERLRALLRARGGTSAFVLGDLADSERDAKAILNALFKLQRAAPCVGAAEGEPPYVLQGWGG